MNKTMYVLTLSTKEGAFIGDYTLNFKEAMSIADALASCGFCVRIKLCK